MDRKTWVDDPTLLAQTADRLEKEHYSRNAMNAAWLQLYYQRPSGGYVARGREHHRAALEALGVYEQIAQLGENLMLEVIDGSLSLTVRKLRCQVIPTGADDYETTRACEALGQLIDGVFETSGFHDLVLEAAKDGHICDVGPLKGYVENGEIKWARQDPLLTFWPLDRTPVPRTIVTSTPMPRENAAALWSKHARDLLEPGKTPSWCPKAVPGVDAFSYSSAKDADTIRIDEAWYASMGKQKGKRAIVAGKIVLDEGAWSHEVTPVVAYRWSKDHNGFAGVSLARVIAPDHVWLNTFIRKVYRALGGAGPKIVYDEQQLDPRWSDLDYDMVPYDSSKGPPPQIVNPSVVSPEVLAEAERRRTRAFAKAKVNQGLGTGQGAPASLTSGRAQREHISAASAALLPQNRALERLYRDAAKVVVVLVAEALASGKVAVRSPMGEMIREVSYQDVEALLTSKKYRITFGLTTGLSLDPSGRLQDLKDLSELLPGKVTPDIVAANLELPDIQALTDGLNAVRKTVSKMISRAINDGQVMTPPTALGAEGFQALVTDGNNRLLQAYMAGHPPEKIQALHRLILAARARLEPPPVSPLPEAVQAQPANDGAPPPAVVAPAAPPPMAPPPAMAQGAA
ncbi:MAG TPA: hypothetical protein VFV05_09515 [Methylomirabilota bacterium]|nr:hypothetical protein [Methylomirabilota bacterium]